MCTPRELTAVVVVTMCNSGTSSSPSAPAPPPPPLTSFKHSTHVLRLVDDVAVVGHALLLSKVKHAVHML